jgi:hypothetical protein
MAYKLGSNSNSGAYDAITKSGLTAGDKTIFKNGNGDGEPKNQKKKVEKTKNAQGDKTKKITMPDGTVKIQIKNKDGSWSNRVIGPKIVKENQAASINVEMSNKITPTVIPAKPSSSYTPPIVKEGNSEEGDSKPFVKPLRSRKEAFNNRGEQFKDMDFPEYNEYINKWNKENPPKNNPPKVTTPSLEPIKAKPIVQLDQQPNFSATIKGTGDREESQYTSFESGGPKKKDDPPGNPPGNPPSDGGSTDDGLCTAANPDSCNAFSEKDGKEGELINRMFGRGDKEKQAQKNSAADARKRKDVADAAISSSSKSFAKDSKKQLKTDQKAFRAEYGDISSSAERKEIKSREKSQRVELKKQTNDRFKTAENRKDKNARQRFRQAENTSGRVSKGKQIGAKITTSLLGKRKQEQRATAGRSTAAAKNRDFLKNKDLAAMTNNKKNRTIKASF